MSTEEIPDTLPSARQARAGVVREVSSHVRRRGSVLDRMGSEELAARLSKHNEALALDEALLVMAQRNILRLEARIKVHRREVDLLGQQARERQSGVVIAQKVLQSASLRCGRCDRRGLQEGEVYCGAGCSRQGPRKRCLNCKGPIERQRLERKSPFCDDQCERAHRQSEAQEDEERQQPRRARR